METCPTHYLGKYTFLFFLCQSKMAICDARRSSLCLIECMHRRNLRCCMHSLCATCMCRRKSPLGRSFIHSSECTAHVVKLFFSALETSIDRNYGSKVPIMLHVKYAILKVALMKDRIISQGDLLMAVNNYTTRKWSGCSR